MAENNDKIVIDINVNQGGIPGAAPFAAPAAPAPAHVATTPRAPQTISHDVLSGSVSSAKERVDRFEKAIEAKLNEATKALESTGNLGKMKYSEALRKKVRGQIIPDEKELLAELAQFTGQNYKNSTIVSDVKAQLERAKIAVARMVNNQLSALTGKAIEGIEKSMASGVNVELGNLVGQGRKGAAPEGKSTGKGLHAVFDKLNRQVMVEAAIRFEMSVGRSLEDATKDLIANLQADSKTGSPLVAKRSISTRKNELVKLAQDVANKIAKESMDSVSSEMTSSASGQKVSLSKVSVDLTGASTKILGAAGSLESAAAKISKSADGLHDAMTGVISRLQNFSTSQGGQTQHGGQTGIITPDRQAISADVMRDVTARGANLATSVPPNPFGRQKVGLTQEVMGSAKDLRYALENQLNEQAKGHLLSTEKRATVPTSKAKAMEVLMAAEFGEADAQQKAERIAAKIKNGTATAGDYAEAEKILPGLGKRGAAQIRTSVGSGIARDIEHGMNSFDLAPGEHITPKGKAAGSFARALAMRELEAVVQSNTALGKIGKEELNSPEVRRKMLEAYRNVSGNYITGTTPEEVFLKGDIGSFISAHHTGKMDAGSLQRESAIFGPPVANFDRGVKGKIQTARTQQVGNGAKNLEATAGALAYGVAHFDASYGAAINGGGGGLNDEGLRQDEALLAATNPAYRAALMKVLPKYKEALAEETRLRQTDTNFAKNADRIDVLQKSLKVRASFKDNPEESFFKQDRGKSAQDQIEKSLATTLGNIKKKEDELFKLQTSGVGAPNTDTKRELTRTQRELKSVDDSLQLLRARASRTQNGRSIFKDKISDKVAERHELLKKIDTLEERGRGEGQANLQSRITNVSQQVVALKESAKRLTERSANINELANATYVDPLAGVVFTRKALETERLDLLRKHRRDMPNEFLKGLDDEVRNNAVGVLGTFSKDMPIGPKARRGLSTSIIPTDFYAPEKQERLEKLYSEAAQALQSQDPVQAAKAQEFFRSPVLGEMFRQKSGYVASDDRVMALKRALGAEGDDLNLPIEVLHSRKKNQLKAALEEKERREKQLLDYRGSAARRGTIELAGESAGRAADKAAGILANFDKLSSPETNPEEYYTTPMGQQALRPIRSAREDYAHQIYSAQKGVAEDPSHLVKFENALQVEEKRRAELVGQRKILSDRLGKLSPADAGYSIVQGRIAALDAEIKSNTVVLTGFADAYKLIKEDAKTVSKLGRSGAKGLPAMATEGAGAEFATGRQGQRLPGVTKLQLKRNKRTLEGMVDGPNGADGANPLEFLRRAGYQGIADRFYDAEKTLDALLGTGPDVQKGRDSALGDAEAQLAIEQGKLKDLIKTKIGPGKGKLVKYQKEIVARYKNTVENLKAITTPMIGERAERPYGPDNLPRPLKGVSSPERNLLTDTLLDARMGVGFVPTSTSMGAAIAKNILPDMKAALGALDSSSEFGRMTEVTTPDLSKLMSIAEARTALLEHGNKTKKIRGGTKKVKAFLEQNAIPKELEPVIEYMQGLSKVGTGPSGQWDKYSKEGLQELISPMVASGLISTKTTSVLDSSKDLGFLSEKRKTVQDKIAGLTASIAESGRPLGELAGSGNISGATNIKPGRGGASKKEASLNALKKELESIEQQIKDEQLRKDLISQITEKANLLAATIAKEELERKALEKLPKTTERTPSTVETVGKVQPVDTSKADAKKKLEDARAYAAMYGTPPPPPPGDNRPVATAPGGGDGNPPPKGPVPLSMMSGESGILALLRIIAQNTGNTVLELQMGKGVKVGGAAGAVTAAGVAAKKVQVASTLKGMPIYESYDKDGNVIKDADWTRREKDYGQVASTISGPGPSRLARKLRDERQAQETKGARLAAGIDLSATRDLAFEGKEGALTTTMRRVLMFGGTSMLVYKAVGALQQFGATVVNMDKQLADLRKTLGGTDADFAKLADTAIKTARDTGTPTQSVLDATELFSKQFKRPEDLSVLSKSAALFSNISGQGIQTSVETITSAIEQYNLSVSQASALTDSWAKMAAVANVTTKDLGDAFGSAGGAAKEAGLSTHELNAIVSVVSASTGKTGKDIGTGLKRMFERVSSPENEKKLAKEGIATRIKGQDGRLEARDFNDILSDIKSGKLYNTDGTLQKNAKGWDEMSSSQKRNIAVLVAGARQYDAFIALMNNYKRVQELVTDSINSDGEAVDQNSRLMNTLSKRFVVLHTQVDALARSVGTTLVPAFSSLVGVLADLVGLLSGHPTLLLALTGVGIAKGLSGMSNLLVRGSIMAKASDGLEYFKNPQTGAFLSQFMTSAPVKTSGKYGPGFTDSSRLSLSKAFFSPVVGAGDFIATTLMSIVGSIIRFSAYLAIAWGAIKSFKWEYDGIKKGLDIYALDRSGDMIKKDSESRKKREQEISTNESYRTKLDIQELEIKSIPKGTLGTQKRREISESITGIVDDVVKTHPEMGDMFRRDSGGSVIVDQTTIVSQIRAFSSQLKEFNDSAALKGLSESFINLTDIINETAYKSLDPVGSSSDWVKKITDIFNPDTYTNLAGAADRAKGMGDRNSGEPGWANIDTRRRDALTVGNLVIQARAQNKDLTKMLETDEFQAFAKEKGAVTASGDGGEKAGSMSAAEAKIVTDMTKDKYMAMRKIYLDRIRKGRDLFPDLKQSSFDTDREVAIEKFTNANPIKPGLDEKTRRHQEGLLRTVAEWIFPRVVAQAKETASDGVLAAEEGRKRKAHIRFSDLEPTRIDYELNKSLTSNYRNASTLGAYQSNFLRNTLSAYDTAIMSLNNDIDKAAGPKEEYAMKARDYDIKDALTKRDYSKDEWIVSPDALKTMGGQTKTNREWLDESHANVMALKTHRQSIQEENDERKKLRDSIAGLRDVINTIVVMDNIIRPALKSNIAATITRGQTMNDADLQSQTDLDYLDKQIARAKEQQIINGTADTPTGRNELRALEQQKRDVKKNLEKTLEANDFSKNLVKDVGQSTFSSFTGMVVDQAAEAGYMGLFGDAGKGVGGLNPVANLLAGALGDKDAQKREDSRNLQRIADNTGQMVEGQLQNKFDTQLIGGEAQSASGLLLGGTRKMGLSGKGGLGVGAALFGGAAGLISLGGAAGLALDKTGSDISSLGGVELGDSLGRGIGGQFVENKITGKSEIGESIAAMTADNLVKQLSETDSFKEGEKTGKDAIFSKGFMGKTAQYAMAMAGGAAMGSQVTAAQGKTGYGGMIGGAVGTGIGLAAYGALIGTATTKGAMTGSVVGPYGAAIGAVVGAVVGIVGSLIGSMFDKQKEPEMKDLPEIEEKQLKELMKINKNLNTVNEIMENLINAPSNFTLPIPKGILNNSITAQSAIATPLQSRGLVIKSGPAYLHAGERVVDGNPVGGGSVSVSNSFVIQGANKDPKEIANEVAGILSRQTYNETQRVGGYRGRF